MITIAISGKGGSGKTTLAAMMIRLLCRQSQGAVLAVDADPNSCLGTICGVEPDTTIAAIREESRQKQPSDGGMDRVRSFEYGIQGAITEAKGFDLVAMGRPEGPGCYCAVNNMLRTFLDKLGSQYRYVIIDNEAGMEHLSRRTTNKVDLLCIAAEPTSTGVATTERIFSLAKELPISVKEIGVIWNRADAPEALKGIDVLGCVPYDQGVFDASVQGKTVFDLAEDSPALVAVRKILQEKLKMASSESQVANRKA
jgi:CO dehydrogenase maturation factor